VNGANRLDGVEAAAGHRAVAQQAAGVLGQLGARGPADVAALWTFVEGRPGLVITDGAPVPAVEALDLPKPVHRDQIGCRRVPESLERGTQG
jgi:hypothetical protein